MAIQVGDIFTTPIYTGEFWCIIEISSKIPGQCKFQKITRVPPLKYFEVDGIILRWGVQQIHSFLDPAKFRMVKFNGEIINEKLYLRFMELILKMDSLQILK